MPFSDKTKKEAKKNAGYKCCWCQNSMDIEVHHINPEEEGGESTIENAVALCPNCHTAFGHDPKKRKEMRNRRTWWYEKVDRMYPDNTMPTEILEKIHCDVKLTRREGNKGFEELKDQLKFISNKAIDEMTMVSSDFTASSIVSTSAECSSATSMLKDGSQDKVRFFEQIKKHTRCPCCYAPFRPTDRFCSTCGIELY